MKRPTPELIRQFVEYNQNTGKFRWKTTSPDMFTAGIRTVEQKCAMFNARLEGREAFTADNGQGYKSAVIRGFRTGAHRVAWAMHYGSWPKHTIDHINGDKTDNRIENLRDVTKSENCRNVSIGKNNKSGILGVRWRESRNTWEADLRYNRKIVFYGRYKCLGEAIQARRNAEAEYGFHGNHGRR